jgi:hypothetical protein
MAAMPPLEGANSRTSSSTSADHADSHCNHDRDHDQTFVFGVDLEGRLRLPVIVDEGVTNKNPFGVDLEWAGCRIGGRSY